MKKLLLSSVCRPFGAVGEGDSVGAELFHAQVTRAQGVFSFRQVIRCWAIDYIAHNIEAPCLVLHYPSEREFVRELKRRDYDYVGISFVVATFHKVRRMAKLIRKYAPQAEIILGGYGTVLPDELLKPFGDHVCREEGVGFMRRLLGESNEKAVEHPYAPIPSVRVYSCHQHANTVGHLTAGLGCPNGCDFCCTSHFFKRKYVPYSKTGREIYESICQMERIAKDRGDHLGGFIIIDEDFFLFEKRAREFLECVRQGGKPLALMGFGSVRGLSKFTADEIAEMGFDTIWTAFEGTEAGYSKLKGKSFEELYSSLKSRGVAILSSMIIGFSYQNRAQILKEFKRLLALRPSMSQILIYFAFPGTPFHQQVLAEGLYLPEYQEKPDFRRWDGFSMHFKHPHFSASELEALQKKLYRLEFERLGPSIVRMARVWYEGYKNLRHSAKPLLRARAERKGQNVRRVLPGIVPAMFFGPTRKARAEARKLYSEIREEFGALPFATRMKCWAAPFLAFWTWLAAKLRIFQEPGLLRVEHRLTGSMNSTGSVLRLQGGIYAQPCLVLAEDITRNVKELLLRLRPARLGRKEEFPTSAVTRPPETVDDRAEKRAVNIL